MTDNAGVLEARDLATGRVLWAVPVGTETRGAYFTGARPDESGFVVQNGEQITSLTW